MIDARATVEWKLLESERRCIELLDSARLLSLMLDRNARIVYCNNVLLELTDRRPEEVQGADWFALFIPPENVEELRGVHASLLANLPGTIHHDNEILTRSGARRLIRWHNSALRSATGGAIGTVSLGEDITEQRRTEEALRASVTFTRGILDSVDAEIAVLDSAGVILAVNESWARFARENGVEPGRPVPHTEVGANYFAVCETRSAIAAQEAWSACEGIRAVLEGRLPRFDLEYPCHSPGQQRWFSMSVTPLGPAWRGVVVSHADITERVQGEVELRKSVSGMRLAQSLARLCSWDWDAATDANPVSVEFYEIFGRDPGNPIVNFLEQRGTIYSVEVWGRIKASRLHAMATGVGYNLVLEARRFDGAPLWIRTRGEVARDESGRIFGMFGTIQDITLAHLAEVAVRESEERLRLALDAARMGTFEWDIPHDKVTWTPTQEALWGYAPGEFGGNREAFMRRVHPDDLSGLDAEVARCFAVRAPLDVEFRVVWPDRSVHWVAAAGQVKFDASGRVVGFRGATVETTARKQNEVDLQRRTAQLQGLAARLAEAEETERERLAQELHDRVGSILTALDLNLTIVRSQLPPQSPMALGQRLDDSMALVRETVELVRDMMTELRPPELRDYGLAPALRWYSERIAKRTGLAVDVEAACSSVRRAPAVEVALFRMAQEALNNVLKHADAHRVTLSLDDAPGLLRLVIADDGRGFDPAKAMDAEGGIGHWGLVMMRERAQSIGGRLSIASSPGCGTRVIIEVST